MPTVLTARISALVTQGGKFELRLRCPPTYPLAPPRVVFITPIFHPNVLWRTGEICLDILKPDAWTPAWTVMRRPPPHAAHRRSLCTPSPHPRLTLAGAGHVGLPRDHCAAFSSRGEPHPTQRSTQPHQTVGATCQLSQPSRHSARAQADSPLNCDCGNLIRNGDMRGYRSLAAMYTKMHAVAADGAGTSAS